VLNRFLVLTHVGTEPAGDARGGEDGAEAGVIVAAPPPSVGRGVGEVGRQSAPTENVMSGWSPGSL
jgi:hypothetical protein